jgi:prepilin-type N-terminal cleavage/methylation domain-containing protein
VRSANRGRSESGFSLIELLVATGLLLIISSIVTNALIQMTNSQKTVWNRTEMHSGIRGATELLQQEVGQAGRVTLPGSGTLLLQSSIDASGISAPCTVIATSPYWSGGVTPTNVLLSSTVGLWADVQKGIKLAVIDGDNSETVTVQAMNTSTNQITACFSRSHTASVASPKVLMALGGFAEGILAPSPTYSITSGGSTITGTYTNGSDKNHLKLFGDVNGDGTMVYVEYVCDNGSIAGVTSPSHNLYRNVMIFDPQTTGYVATKPAVTPSQILLTNVYPNPSDTDGSERPCFKYQWATVNGQQYVLDVAITLTVQTQQIDPLTRQYQTETKALLNVSPRNVFDVWTMAGYSESNRVQFTPPRVTALLPNGTP